MKLNIAAFASHGGSNLQAIIDGIKKGQLDGQIKVVISNNSDSFALIRAARENIPHFHISAYTHEKVDEKILELMHMYDINIIVLAGYMKKLPDKVIDEYRNHILNIHPALLPGFGGKGMYGLNVHRAVIEAKEEYTGVTVHLVNENYDEGDILHQIKVKVMKDDTPESLAARVLTEEHKIYLETLKMISTGKIMLK
ncbi:MAG: phosphoribosylglycinamide formyltransferase [Clostridia bacterium]|nr:phosphoribosylglycinamide formyltransferase [Clostridia bacterium]